jgi:hypothetical protein
MASIPELLDGHVTLEVECLDRLYLNGYIGPLATSGGLVAFMREQLGKPIPSPVVLGQVTEKFREAVKEMAERERIPVYQFDHKPKSGGWSQSNPACSAPASSWSGDSYHPNGGSAEQLKLEVSQGFGAAATVEPPDLG